MGSLLGHYHSVSLLIILNIIDRLYIFFSSMILNVIRMKRINLAEFLKLNKKINVSDSYEQYWIKHSERVSFYCMKKHK